MNLVTIGTKNGAFVPSISPEALGKRDAVLGSVALFCKVNDLNTLEIATGHVRTIRTIVKLTEESRVVEKKPYKEAAEKIDELAKDFVRDLLVELSRIDLLIQEFHVEKENNRRREQAAIRAEQERIAAEQARAEHDAREKRETEEREIARVRAEVALAERQKIEAAQREQDASKREELERQARFEREAALANAERLQREAAEREAEEKRIAAAIATARESQVAPASAPVAVKGQRVETEVRFEVVDAARLYRAHPDFFELKEKRSAIKTAISSGRITIPTCPVGLRMWEEVVVKDTTRRKSDGLTLEA